MYPVKNSKYDLRFQYRKVLEICLICSLVIHLAAFRLVPDMGADLDLNKNVAVEIKVEDIPQTEQMRDMPPPPPMPSVPVPSESELIPEDLTIETTDLNLDLSQLPPPPPQDDADDAGYTFIPYDEPPAPIGGYAAILKNLKYPEIARKSGMEAYVVVGVLISADGRALKTQIMQGASVDLGFEEAAANAVMMTKWKPAKQRDQAIKVWVTVPVRFKLRTSGEPIS